MRTQNGTKKANRTLKALYEELRSNYSQKEIGECYFQVSHLDGGTAWNSEESVTLGFCLTFRRMTHGEALGYYKNDLNRASEILKNVAASASGVQAQLTLPTRPSEDEYSEYEQCLGGCVVFTAKKANSKQAPSNTQKSPNKAESTKANRQPRIGTKQATVVDMLKRNEGATLTQIMEATGWQVHTTRAVLSRTIQKDLGIPLTSEKTINGDRIYRIA